MAKKPEIKPEEIPRELELEKMPFEEYCRHIFDPKRTFEKPEALKGIRWLSCTMYIFTPHSACTLAEYGAEVIKIELPRLADPMRHTSPFNESYFYPLHDDRPMTGTGIGLHHANLNDYFITLDYHAPEAKEVMYDLVRISDGLTDVYRPGTFYRWGFGYPQVMKINPRFIYVWGGGFGFGPKMFGGSYDILGQSQGGLASITGFHEDMGGFPAKHSNWIIDWLSGLLITCGILSAIYWRRKTGLGTMIEFSQVHVSSRSTGYAIPLYHRFGVVRQRWGNWDTQLCVHGIIMTGKTDYPDDPNPQLADETRYVFVSAFEDEDYKELCSVINRHDLWEKYKTAKERLRPDGQMEIYRGLEDWAKDKSRSEVVEILTNAGLLAYPVMNAKDVYECEHFRTRGTIRWIEDPSFGDVLVHGGFSDAILSETPPRVRWIWRPVGADNVKIYHDLLGYPISKIEELYKRAII